MPLIFHPSSSGLDSRSVPTLSLPPSHLKRNECRDPNAECPTENYFSLPHASRNSLPFPLRVVGYGLGQGCSTGLSCGIVTQIAGSGKIKGRSLAFFSDAIFTRTRFRRRCSDVSSLLSSRAESTKSARRILFYLYLSDPDSNSAGKKVLNVFKLDGFSTRFIQRGVGRKETLFQQEWMISFSGHMNILNKLGGGGEMQRPKWGGILKK